MPCPKQKLKKAFSKSLQAENFLQNRHFVLKEIEEQTTELFLLKQGSLKYDMFFLTDFSTS